MTIRDVAELTGLTHQAVYKRIKTAGISLASVKDKETGQLTPDGEAAILELFNLESKPVEKKVAESPEVAELRTRVAELSKEVEGLRKQVETIEAERDYLRTALSNAQQLQAMTLSKFALPAPAQDHKGRLRNWFERRREAKNKPETQDIDVN